MDVLCSTYAASHGFPEAVCEDECLSGIVGGEVAERVARDHLGPDGAVFEGHVGVAADDGCSTDVDDVRLQGCGVALSARPDRRF